MLYAEPGTNNKNQETTSMTTNRKLLALAIAGLIAIPTGLAMERAAQASQTHATATTTAPAAQESETNEGPETAEGPESGAETSEQPGAEQPQTTGSQANDSESSDSGPDGAEAGG
jgi:hypothetical protein